MVTSQTHPCVFRGSFIRDQIDPRINERWKQRWDRSAPFGNLRKLFRDSHCSIINPYDSSYCPYSERDCAIAFYQCAVKTVNEAHDLRSATGYFRSVARSFALHRVDNKPLARSRVEAIPKEGSGNTRASRPGDQTGHGDGPEDGDQDVMAVRRDVARPVHIGDLLRGIDARSRQGPTEDG